MENSKDKIGGVPREIVILGGIVLLVPPAVVARGNGPIEAILVTGLLAMGYVGFVIFTLIKVSLKG
jgi:hypothetical protein